MDGGPGHTPHPCIHGALTATVAAAAAKFGTEPGATNMSPGLITISATRRELLRGLVVPVVSPPFEDKQYMQNPLQNWNYCAHPEQSCVAFMALSPEPCRWLPANCHLLTSNRLLSPIHICWLPCNVATLQHCHRRRLFSFRCYRLPCHQSVTLKSGAFEVKKIKRQFFYVRNTRHAMSLLDPLVA